MSGWDGEIDDIVKEFVAKFKREVESANTEVQAESFTTEPTSY